MVEAGGCRREEWQLGTGRQDLVRLQERARVGEGARWQKILVARAQARRRMADRNQVTEILLGGKGQVVGE